MTGSTATGNGGVVVTGSSGAIGSAVVDAFLGSGYEVVGIDLQDWTNAQPNSYRHVVADVCDPEAMASVAALLSSGGPIRHVVGVAGGAISEEIAPRQVQHLNAAVFRRSLDLNLVAQYITVHALLPLLRESAADATGGRADRSVTVISSINGLVGMDLPAYSAAKAGLLGLVRVLARLLGPDSIRVNAVAPGTVRTPRTENAWCGDPDHFERLRRRAPIGRLTTPAEVAKAVHALAVDLTAVTGQTLVVDAGQTAAFWY